MADSEDRMGDGREQATVPVAEHLEAVHERIRAAAISAQRDPESITLVAVSKGQPVERIDAALVAGQRVFGENYVQEAEAHWASRRSAFPDLDLHMIGALQTNKARDAVALFDTIQTVDRPKLARALAREMERQRRRVRCLVQINTGEEPQKAGVWPKDADALIGVCRDELNLPIEGVMAIPPEDEEPSLHAALLARIATRNGLPVVSIGMSSDFEIAIAFGATHVRVGTLVFGPRLPRRPAAA